MNEHTIQRSIKTFIVLCLLCAGCTHEIAAQDTIQTHSKIILANVLEVSSAFVRYKNIENPDGPEYSINRNDIYEIHYKNGYIEKFSEPPKPEPGIKETKEFIVEKINAYGYEEDEDGPYRATFEGDMLRLQVLNRKGIPNRGILYDFSTVYKFQNNSLRSNNIAFINIYVSILKNPLYDVWDKHKLIMRVKGHQNAESILQALKHLNKLLLDNVKSDSKF